MTTHSCRRFWLVPVLALSLCLCRADTPSGVITLNFNNPATAVYDMAGGLQISEYLLGSGGSVTPLSFGVDVTQDVRGRISGTGSTILTVGGDTVAAVYTVKGQISGGGGHPTRLTLSIRLHGQDVLAGKETPFNLSLSYALENNAEASAFVGRARGTFNAARLGRGRIRADDSSIAAAASRSTAWALEMNVAALNRLAGTARFLLPARAALPADVRGHYSAADDLSKAKVTGTNEGRGNRLDLQFMTAGSTAQVTRINGVVLGQRVRF